MEERITAVTLGALCWNQYTDFPSLLEAGRRADRLGYDTLWTWSPVYPTALRCSMIQPSSSS